MFCLCHTGVRMSHRNKVSESISSIPKQYTTLKYFLYPLILVKVCYEISIIQALKERLAEPPPQNPEPGGPLQVSIRLQGFKEEIGWSPTLRRTHCTGSVNFKSKA